MAFISSTLPNSILNDNVSREYVLDANEPFSLIQFSNIVKKSFEKESISENYNQYLKDWNNKTNNSQEEGRLLIVNKYKDFLKEISLDYTTSEEKKFLSLIDYNDPEDLDIAIGFFAKKLNTIGAYNRDIRHDVKHSLTKTKLEGSVTGLKKSIAELVINYLKNYENGYYYYNIDQIKDNIEVQLSELYDCYPNYYNQTPDELVYDKKDLDYGLDIFLKSNNQILAETFSNISIQLKEWKELDNLLDNKRKQTISNVFCDFYYLSTGDSINNYTVGKLFDSDLKSKNFLNRNYPTSQSTQNYDYLKSEREMGFFKPNKKSIILVDGKTSSYTFNLSALAPNSIYYFPDPNVISDKSDIITFKFDVEYLKCNKSSGNAFNRPKSTDNINYFGYKSLNSPITNNCLNDAYNKGYVLNFFNDFYGNSYALFKNDNKFVKSVTNVDYDTNYQVIFNGHTFYDNYYDEGYTFNYSISDNTTYKETIRSGLSALSSSFIGQAASVALDFGSFSNYPTFKKPTEAHLVSTVITNEGGFFTKLDNTLYLDTISSDLSSFENGGGTHYFNKLIEGGVRSTSPLKRGLYDPSYPTLSSNLLFNPKADGVIIADGGRFDEFYDFSLNLSKENYEYDTSETYSSTTFAPISTISNQYSGKLMVKNIYTGEFGELLEMFPYITNKYTSDILDELSNNVKEIYIYNNCLFIRTKSYFLIEYIELNSGLFVNPKKETYIIDNFIDSQNISNILNISNNVYYVVQNLEVVNGVSKIYPEIYKFDTETFKNSKIFPSNESSVEALSSLFYYNNGIVYSSMNQPFLSYDPESNLITLSTVLKDPNGYFDIQSMTYQIKGGDVVFKKSNLYNNNIYRKTNTFNSSDELNIYVSKSYTLSGNALIL